jgi:hypothetical protein
MLNPLALSVERRCALGEIDKKEYEERLVENFSDQREVFPCPNRL